MLNSLAAWRAPPYFSIVFALSACMIFIQINDFSCYFMLELILICQERCCWHLMALSDYLSAIEARYGVKRIRRHYLTVPPILSCC